MLFAQTKRFISGSDQLYKFWHGSSRGRIIFTNFGGVSIPRCGLTGQNRHLSSPHGLPLATRDEKVPGALFAGDPAAAVFVRDVRKVPGTFSGCGACSEYEFVKWHTVSTKHANKSMNKRCQEI
jgi:hypothetical protein